MNSSTSSSDNAPNKTRKDGLSLKVFFSRIMLPFLLITGISFYMIDRVMRDRVIFRTPILGAAKIHRSIHRRSPEIPILGSSRALGSYIPDSLSLRSYNYGINGTGYEVVDMFLDLECNRKRALTPIVINFDYEMFNNSLGDLNNYIPNIRHSGVRDLLKRHDKYNFQYELFGIRFFNSYDLFIKDYINYRVQLTKAVTLGASLEKNKLSPAAFNKLVEKRLKKKAKWNPLPGQIDRLIAHIHSRPDRIFVIAVAPYHWSYYESFEGINEAHATLDMLDSIPNAMVVNEDGCDYPDSLFVNTSHLNFYGAVRYTNRLRKIMFGDRKGDWPTPAIWPPGYGPYGKIQ